MHKNSLNGLIKTGIILKILILVLFFFTACTRKNLIIPAEDKDKVRCFLNQFLFVNNGVYTLYGDKPVSEMLLFIGTENDLTELNEEEQKTALPLDESIVENWRTWKKYVHKISLKNFIIAERPCFSDPSHIIYSILNITTVKEIFRKHHRVFQDRLGIHFDSNKVIQEFKDQSSYFWRKIFGDHYLSGLLFGYGEENIIYFLEHVIDQKGNIHFSDKYNPSATAENFPIPIFAVSPQDKTVARYLKQKKFIQNIYQNQDTIEITLQRLIE